MHLIFYLLVILPLGLAFGSFLSALSYRLPREISIKKGRSFCPNCKKQINWYDNIPLLSYILLGGKCRNCKKKISKRYPIIEFSILLLFTLIYFAWSNCNSLVFAGNPLCGMQSSFGIWSLPYLLLLTVVIWTIFITDLEHQIIPDVLVFILIVTITIFALFSGQDIWPLFFSGFTAGTFLLLLHIFTKGKGMGLGDAKFAIPVGMLFGIKLTVAWLFLSFILGAVIGVILIALGKAKLGVQIAFGPFLVISFFIILLFGSYLVNFLFIT